MCNPYTDLVCSTDKLEHIRTHSLTHSLAPSLPHLMARHGHILSSRLYDQYLLMTDN